MLRVFAIVLMMLSGISANRYYSDRFLVYIDNSVEDFIYTASPDGPWTNQSALNQRLAESGVIDFQPWLRNAKPDDHDGEIFLSRIFAVTLSESRSDLAAVLPNFAGTPGLQNPELWPIMKSSYTPNDPQFNQQWFLPNVQATEAWDLWDIDGGVIPGTVTGDEIIVGVVDDGIHWTHPDLIGNIWNNLGEDSDGDGVTVEYVGGAWVLDSGDLNSVDDDEDGYVDNLIGWDVAVTSGGAEDNDPYPVAGDGHGTNVSGCVSGSTNNNLGIASVGWSVKIMPIKTSYTNNGYIDFGYDGILAAAQQGANVINCSWGGYGFSSYAQNLINTCYNTYGTIVVSSAGNGNQDYGVTNTDTHYPSGYDNVISVTATGNGDHFNCWATAGTTVDLGAPGENVRTTSGSGGYESAWGTSFSSPITASAVALLWSFFPEESKEWIIDKIINSTDYYADMDRDCSVHNNDDTSNHTESMTGLLGSGRLNIFKAIAGGLFPSLTVQEVNLQNDSDGDGVFNPGETVKAKIIIANGAGWATATNVTAVLSSADPRVTITDNIIEFTSDIYAGTSSFTLFDSFELMATADALVGPVPCLVTLYAGSDPYIYVNEQEILIELSLAQAGFPFSTTSSVKTSPTAIDLNGDGENEIYFGSDDFNLYGIDVEAQPLAGFPFSTGNQIRSTPAFGDVQNDGDLEIIFGSKDKSLYIVNYDGTTDAVYTATGYIMHTPCLVDLDGDQDLEIVFGTFEPGSSGKVYAVHHDGSDVAGFPVTIGEIIMAAPAVGDLENDGIIDIVVGTWSNKIYALTSTGQIKSGFPFTTGNRINVAPSLANVIGDDQLEIVAGSDDRNLYILNADGSEITRLVTGGMIRASASFYDYNNDGYADILFGSQDQNLYFYNAADNQAVAGWPINLGGMIYSSPVLADLNNDGAQEVIAGFAGGVSAFNLDGTILGNMPINFSSTVESSPAVQDIDQDGDLEILVGSSGGVEVIDMKTAAGSTDFWNVYRGSFRRTGSFNDVNLETISGHNNQVPMQFAVGAAYPNPFNPSTRFTVSIPAAGWLTVSIFNILGQEIIRLADREMAIGNYSISWNGKSSSNRVMGTGLYFLTVKFQDQIRTQKVLLVK